eukprot:CAMPEP_0198319978 /NCGR_PEP_ID=MMETSP1450-20131203/8999_1 /TAXON_ID=753684 ORGANISM="Madagascaria erythrocladiodes, Strain CCMP3234" /NCGR_SAMPLE_ID=MMETSP1450 /ASSEMBLY_ACC=CAM_ASM_001115 /LENGTH=169 /DNA_ID=CAMNT_0044023405 /DNA_START=227 /DNA_END=733 /DNA_ORIENTATION=-
MTVPSGELERSSLHRRWHRGQSGMAVARPLIPSGTGHEWPTGHVMRAPAAPSATPAAAVARSGVVLAMREATYLRSAAGSRTAARLDERSAHAVGGRAKAGMIIADGGVLSLRGGSPRRWGFGVAGLQSRGHPPRAPPSNSAFLPDRWHALTGGVSARLVKDIQSIATC